MTGQGAPACRKEIWDNALTRRRVGKEGRGTILRGKGCSGMKEMEVEDRKGGNLTTVLDASLFYQLMSCTSTRMGERKRGGLVWTKHHDHHSGPVTKMDLR